VKVQGFVLSGGRMDAQCWESFFLQNAEDNKGKMQGEFTSLGQLFINSLRKKKHRGYSFYKIDEGKKNIR
jgi:hypothetical protein